MPLWMWAMNRDHSLRLQHWCGSCGRDLQYAYQDSLAIRVSLASLGVLPRWNQFIGSWEEMDTMVRSVLGKKSTTPI